MRTLKKLRDEVESMRTANIFASAAAELAGRIIESDKALVEALARAMWEYEFGSFRSLSWLTSGSRNRFRKRARAILLAIAEMEF